MLWPEQVSKKINGFITTSLLLTPNGSRRTYFIHYLTFRDSRIFDTRATTTGENVTRPKVAALPTEDLNGEWVDFRKRREETRKY